jgi:hypothetical protein
LIKNIAININICKTYILYNIKINFTMIIIIMIFCIWCWYVLGVCRRLTPSTLVVRQWYQVTDVLLPLRNPLGHYMIFYVLCSSKAWAMLSYNAWSLAIHHSTSESRGGVIRQGDHGEGISPHPVSWNLRYSTWPFNHYD